MGWDRTERDGMIQDELGWDRMVQDEARQD